MTGRVVSNSTQNNSTGDEGLVLVQNEIFDNNHSLVIGRGKEVNFEFYLLEEDFSQADNFTLMFYVNSISNSGSISASLDDAVLVFTLPVNFAPLIITKHVGMGWNTVTIPKNAVHSEMMNKINVYHREYVYDIKGFRLFYMTRITRAEAEAQNLSAQKL